MTIREMMAMYHSLQFVEELLDYIEQYPDDDYMTMECLCRKLVKYHLMSKVDGYYTADRKTEPKRGEWKIEETESVWGKGYLLTCSVCGDTLRVTENALPYEKYCRNCGADMRESEGE